MGCHAVATIGLKTSRGQPLARTRPGPAFHQALTTTDCLACHTGHAGPRLSHLSGPRFSHDLLKPGIRPLCATCHVPPDNALHRGVQGNCSSCHTPRAWTPATFDHQRFFPLTGPHNARCATCHTGGDSPVFNRIRALTLADYPVCQTCPDRPFCRRSNGVVFVNTGDYTAPEEWTCAEAALLHKLHDEGTVDTDGLPGGKLGKF